MYPQLQHVVETHGIAASGTFRKRLEIIDTSRADILERAKQGSAPIVSTLDIRTRLGYLRHQKTVAYEIHKKIDMLAVGALYILPNGMYAIARTYDLSLLHRSHLRIIEPRQIPPIHINSIRLDTF